MQAKHRSSNKKPKRLKANNLYKVLSDETIRGIKQGSVYWRTVVVDLATERIGKERLLRTYDGCVEELCSIFAGVLAKMAFGTFNAANEEQDHRLIIEIVKLAQALKTSFRCVKSPLDEAGLGEWVKSNMGHFDPPVEDNVSTGYEVQLAAFQQEHDRLVENWTEVIVGVTGHGPGHHSQAYKTTLDRFGSIWDEHIRIKEAFANQMRRGPAREPFLKEFAHALFACIGLEHGHDSDHLRCWECDIDDKNVFKCSGCDVARYCGPECQRKSWCEGHNAACKALKIRHEQLVENVRFVTKTIEAGAIGLSSNIAPNPCLDFDLIPSLINSIDIDSFQGHAASSPTGPSMAKVYKVIQDIENGESQYASADSNGKDVEYSTGRAIDKIEAEDACRVIMALQYRDATGTSKEENQDEFRGGLKYFMQALQRQLKTIRPKGEVMTTDRVLEIYKSYQEKFASAEEDKIYDRLARDIVYPNTMALWDFCYVPLLFQFLRNNYHKNPQKCPTH
ncbi:expressed unknown protein [Seminavis robusta]|uniref:MYND-type domain-containing protein n=1 Tax=Seminavis robusta TaxID=568900 RepID=A0A9N8DQW3_9STRA|nr:expressed unknown protein [Seminavis robusta]|eukprot:Sro217_g089800.1 n/a (507) ;mRNA; r:61330-62850